MAQLAFALIVYAITIAIALAQGWRANDLVWGFWISGIAVSLYAAVGVPLICLVWPRASAQDVSGMAGWGSRVTNAAGSIVWNLAVFGFFVVPLLFGVTGLMLNSFSPLMPNSMLQMRGGNLFGTFMLVEEALGRFWPLAIACCVACSSSIFYAAASARENQESQVADMVATIEALRAGALVVLAMFTQLALGTFSKIGATIANYALLFLLLFPWTAIFEWNTRKSVQPNGRAFKKR